MIPAKMAMIAKGLMESVCMVLAHECFLISRLF